MTTANIHDGLERDRHPAKVSLHSVRLKVKLAVNDGAVTREPGNEHPLHGLHVWSGDLMDVDRERLTDMVRAYGAKAVHAIVAHLAETDGEAS